jgi:Flp pilus assembly protein TadD
MSGYVVCPACGSRMKAGRGHCLRCFETLPVDAPEAPQPWLSQGRTLIVGVVLTLGALLLSAVIWERATPPVDDIARPAASTPKTPAQPPGVAAVPSESPVAGSGRPPILEPGFVRGPRAETASTADPAAAQTAYEKALVQRPDDAETLNKLGQVLVALGKIDEALPRFERAAALAPDKWLYHFNQAHAASQLLLWDRAVAEYRRASAIQAGDQATQFDLALALHKKGDEAAAIPEFEKAIALAPSDARAHLGLAIALERNGRMPDAIRSYRRFLELEPGSPDAEKLKAYLDSINGAEPASNR